MAVNSKGYLTRRVTGVRSNAKHYTEMGALLYEVAKKKGYRDWWLVKYNGSGRCGYIPALTLPKEYAGKRVMIKIEVLHEKDQDGI